MDSELELRVNKHRLVLSPIKDEMLLEITTPTNAKEGHGWGLLAQVRLDPEHVEALHSYLTERIGENDGES